MLQNENDMHSSLCMGHHSLDIANTTALHTAVPAARSEALRGEHQSRSNIFSFAATSNRRSHPCTWRLQSLDSTSPKIVHTYCSPWLSGIQQLQLFSCFSISINLAKNNHVLLLSSFFIVHHHIPKDIVLSEEENGERPVTTLITQAHLNL